MPKSSKNQGFRFSFKVFFRLIVFILLVYVSINYLGSNNSNISIPFPNLYQYLPPKSQQVLGETTTYLQSSQLTEKINQSIGYAKEFPQKHLQQLKVDIINTIARELINRIQTK